MGISKAHEDLLDSAENLSQNINLFRNGKASAYRIIATILCSLLINDKKNGAFLKRLFPKIKLHPVQENNMLNILKSIGVDEKHIKFLQDGTLSVRGNGDSELILFDFFAKPIELDSWLKQRVVYIESPISIEELLRSVRDKESSHLDPDYNDTLANTRSVSYGENGCHKEIIISIGEYILQILNGIINFKNLPDK